jgi:hypothetical protein
MVYCVRVWFFFRMAKLSMTICTIRSTNVTYLWKTLLFGVCSFIEGCFGRILRFYFDEGQQNMFAWSCENDLRTHWHVREGICHVPQLMIVSRFHTSVYSFMVVVVKYDACFSKWMWWLNEYQLRSAFKRHELGVDSFNKTEYSVWSDARLSLQTNDENPNS